VLNKGKVAGI